MWYYGQWQSAYENLDIPKLRLEEGLPKSFDTGKRNVVVSEDLMAETDGMIPNDIRNHFLTQIDFAHKSMIVV